MFYNFIEKQGGENLIIYEKKNYDKIITIYKGLNYIKNNNNNNNNNIFDLENIENMENMEDIKELNEKQKEVIKKIYDKDKKNYLVMVQGYGGTGKTHCITGFIKIENELCKELPFKKPHSLIMSFMGMTVNVLEERIKNDKKLNLQNIDIYIRTAHTAYYQSKSKSPIIECEYLIIDETQNISFNVFFLICKIMLKLPKCKKIIFLGDIHQTGPIEKGNIFSELIKTFPDNLITLEENKRVKNNKGSGVLINLIRSIIKHKPNPVELLNDLENIKNIKENKKIHIKDVDTIDDINDIVVKLYKQYINNFENILYYAPTNDESDHFNKSIKIEEIRNEIIKKFPKKFNKRPNVLGKFFKKVEKITFANSKFTTIYNIGDKIRFINQNIFKTQIVYLTKKFNKKKSNNNNNNNNNKGKEYIDYVESSPVVNGETSFITNIYDGNVNGRKICIFFLLNEKKVCCGYDPINPIHPFNIKISFCNTIHSVSGMSGYITIYNLGKHKDISWSSNKESIVALSRATDFIYILSIKDPIKISTLKYYIRSRKLITPFWLKELSIFLDTNEFLIDFLMKKNIIENNESNNINLSTIYKLLCFLTYEKKDTRTELGLYMKKI